MTVPPFFEDYLVYLARGFLELSSHNPSVACRNAGAWHLKYPGLWGAISRQLSTLHHSATYTPDAWPSRPPGPVLRCRQSTPRLTPEPWESPESV